MDKSSEYNLYKDIQARTGGEIYIGVVGPVRTGKSTLIKRFMELLVLPAMEDTPEKERTRDQMPQSASGKTIMTTEPKFIPKEGASVVVGEDIRARIRLIDCVGYMVDGAVGHEENGEERMVKTPWFDYEVPFTKAAEIGTRKVIAEHSTIGMVVTTDGSFGDLPRNAYIGAEERTIQELKSLGKPFIVILNSERPYSEETMQLADSLSEKYGTSVLPVSCEQLKQEDILRILESVLLEFPVGILAFHIPKWMELLPISHALKQKVTQHCRNILGRVAFMKDIADLDLSIDDSEVEGIERRDISLAEGSVNFEIMVEEGCYYRMLSEFAGIPIGNEQQLLRCIRELASQREEYDRVRNAMEEVRYKGYGIVIPGRSEIQLEEPEVVKQGNKFGVRMRASAPSIHMIKADIRTEIAPLVGSEQQAEDLIQYIRDAGNQNEEGIWDTNIFGKSIGQIVNDGIQTKTSGMSDDVQMKMQNALQKIINTNSNGMICIIL